MDYSDLLSPDLASDEQKRAALVAALTGKGMPVQPDPNALLLSNPLSAPMGQAAIASNDAKRQAGIQQLAGVRDWLKQQADLKHQGIEEGQKNQQLEIERVKAANEQEQLKNHLFQTDRDFNNRVGNQDREFQNKVSQQDATKVEALSKAVGPHAQFFKTLGDIKQAMAADNGTPGVGVVAGQLPSFLVGDKGRQLRQLLGTASLQFDKATSGSGGMRSPEMLAQMKQASGLFNSNNPDSIRQGLQLLEQLANSDVQAKAAGFDPRIQQIYAQRHPGVPMGGEQAQPSGDRVVVVTPDGKKWHIPKARLDDAVKRGAKLVQQ